MASSSQQSDYSKAVFRQNLSGTAYERHRAYVRDYVDVYGGNLAVNLSKRTEFDVLKEKHRFLREDNAPKSSTGNLTWGDALAMKYESSLYKEYAVCDLKHYKSGNVALRWRTEEEALSSIGEETCGNTRCAYHAPQTERPVPKLLTLEVPFAYVEAGERKSALVKLVLCERCEKKLMWKRRKDKEAAQAGEANTKASPQREHGTDNINESQGNRGEKAAGRRASDLSDRMRVLSPTAAPDAEDKHILSQSHRRDMRRHRSSRHRGDRSGDRSASPKLHGSGG